MARRRSIHCGKGSKLNAASRTTRREPYRWLGVGAVTLGLGVALTNGPGIAYADESTTTGTSTTDGGAASQGGASSSAPGQPNSTTGADAQGEPAATTGDTDPSTTPTAGAEGSHTSTEVGGGSGPTATFGNSSNTGSLSAGEQTNEPATAELNEVAPLTPTSVSAEPTVDYSPPEQTAALTSRPTPEPLHDPTGEVKALNITSTEPAGQTLGVATLPREHSPIVRQAVASNAPVASAPVPPMVPPPTLIETVVAVPGTIVSTALNLITAAFGPLIGPGAPADNPILWGVLAFVRQQFNRTFANSTPVLTPRQTSQDLDDRQVHGAFGAADLDGDTLTYAVPTTGAGAPAHGTVSIDQATGTWTYTPYASFAGEDRFFVTATDDASGFHIHALGQGHSAAALVTVGVAPGTGTNTAPSITSVTRGLVNPRTGAVNYTVTLADVDTPDSALRVQVTQADADGGTVTGETRPASGIYVFTYTPDPQERLLAWTNPSVRNVDITISVSDGTNPPVTQTINVPINASARFAAVSIDGSEQESWGNQGLAVGLDGRYYATTYLVDNTAGQVVVLTPDGQYSHTIDLASVVPYAFVSAYDVAVGSDGKVYVSGEVGDTLDEVQQESGRGVIVVIDPTDDTATVFADVADPLSAIAIGFDGRVYAANWNSDAVRVLNSDGSLYRTIDSEPLVADDDSGVTGLALTRDGRLYLAKPQMGVLKVVTISDGAASVIDLDGEPWSVAIGSNGVAYVTSFDDSVVALVDPTGVVFHTFELGAGASPSDITVAADGRVHVAYLVANGGVIAVISAVAPVVVESTTVGPVVSGVPSGPPLVTEGTVYQVVSGVDSSGRSVVTVVVAPTTGNPKVVEITGEPIGAAVLDPAGNLYQALSSYDAVADTYQTGIVRVAPDGSHVFTGLAAGTALGTVVFDERGTAYQIAVTEEATTVLAVSAAGATTVYTIVGRPEFLVALPGDQPTATVNGVVYLTTIDDGDVATTYLTALAATGGTSFTVAGFASGPPAATGSGTVVLTVARSTLDAEQGVVTFTTVVTALSAEGLTDLAETAAGLPVGGPVAASDGKLYQTLANVDTDTDGTTSEPYTSVLSIGATGLNLVFEHMPGTPVSGTGIAMPLVAGAGGIVFQSTYGYTDPGTGEPVTLVAAISSTGIVNGAVVQGQPTGTPVVGAGTAYQTTYDAASDTTYVLVLTPTSTATETFTGRSTSAAVAPDGTFYVIVLSKDPFGGADVTTVVVASGTDIVAASRSGSPSGTVVFDSNGSAYLTISSADFAQQTTYSQVLTINGDSLTPFGAAIRGVPAGSPVVGNDGTIYQAVLDPDSTGSFTSMVHVVEPVVSIARAVAAASMASNTYVVDDAYIARFLAADPTLRFAYTRWIIGARGMAVDFPPMSDAELVDYVKRTVDLTGLTSAGFGSDSQGRITFRNSLATDVLVLYGARPDRIAQGSVLARPGQTIVLSAGPEGRVAAAYRPGTAFDQPAISIFYRGATPIQATKPKADVTASATSSSNTIKTADLLNRIQGMRTDAVQVDIVKTGSGQRMVVYLSGVNGGDLGIGGSIRQVTKVRYLGLVPGYASSAIDDAMKVHPNITDIMLVGHSAGGMIAQNYIRSGTHREKVKVLVASGSPIISVPDDRIKVIFLRDPYDTLVETATNRGDLSSNEGKGRVYNTPPGPDSGKHDFGNYKKIAQNFDWDSKWVDTKKARDQFYGTIIATNPKPPANSWIPSFLKQFA